LGGLRIINIILSKNPFNPKVHTYKATSAPIFISKFEEKKFQPLMGFSYRTTKDCHSCWSLLLVWQICSLNWDLDMHSFVGTLCISFDGPVAKYMLEIQGA
jgi:hypothetical protein